MAKKQETNDNNIIELKNKIAEKKKALKATENFNPKTNCSLKLGETVSTNIRAEVSKERLTQLLVEVNMLKMSADNLKINDYKLSGYSPSDWVDDLQARLMIVDKKQEENRLKVLEEKLNALLSLDKKVELELQGLSNQI